MRSGFEGREVEGIFDFVFAGRSEMEGGGGPSNAFIDDDAIGSGGPAKVDGGSEALFGGNRKRKWQAIIAEGLANGKFDVVGDGLGGEGAAAR